MKTESWTESEKEQLRQDALAYILPHFASNAELAKGPKIFVRGEGCYVGLGCHYDIAFDKAMLRRDEASLMPVRRSKDKFPTVLDFLSRHPGLFEQLIGSVVKFENLPDIMKKRSGTPTGTGGPKMVVEF